MAFCLFLPFSDDHLKIGVREKPSGFQRVPESRITVVLWPRSHAPCPSVGFPLVGLHPFWMDSRVGQKEGLSGSCSGVLFMIRWVSCLGGFSETVTKHILLLKGLKEGKQDALC